MILRELSKMSSVVHLNLVVEGRQLRRVEYQGNCQYLAYFGTGEILTGKGHQRPDQLRSSDRIQKYGKRIQKYGEYGTSI
jgi:hypothetical protein